MENKTILVSHVCCCARTFSSPSNSKFSQTRLRTTMRNSDWRYIALNMTLACFWLLSSADDISVHSWAFSPDVLRLHPLLLKWTRLISSGLGWQHLCSWEGVHIGHTLRALLQTEDLMLVVVFLVFVPYCPIIALMPYLYVFMGLHHIMVDGIMIMWCRIYKMQRWPFSVAAEGTN